MSKKTTGKELAEVKKAPLPAQQEVLNIDDMVTDEGQGLENIGAADMALPFLVVLQSGSPQVKKGDAKIEGAVEGHIFNTVSQEVYDGDEGIYVVPCLYKKSFVEWKPREAGGGFVAQYEDDSVLARTRKDTKGRDMLESGNLIVATAYHYVLLINVVNGDFSRAVIGMSSTQLKKSRRWNSIMTGLRLTKSDGTKFTPPMFSHLYRLTTEAESNEYGNWCGWKVEISGAVPNKEIYTAAKKYAAELKSGAIREATPPQTEFGAHIGSADEDAPF
jgi:hypothetical protein